jgi:hypothetical protein
LVAHIIILSENLPTAADDSIKVEMISPEGSNIHDIANIADEDNFIFNAIEHYMAKNPKSNIAEQSQSFNYINKLSGNIYWIFWSSTGSREITFKYTITWPVIEEN